MPRKAPVKKATAKASAAKKIASGEEALPVPDPNQAKGEKVPITEHNWAIIEQMALAMCSVEEMGAYLGLHNDQFYSEVNSARFKECTSRKRTTTKYLLRRRQIDKALTGRQPVDSIWAGKQYLDQRDHSEVTHTGGERLLEAGARAMDRMLALLDKVKEIKQLDAGEVVEAEIVEQQALPEGETDDS